MNRDNFKKEFYEELEFFRNIAFSDLKKGFTVNQVGVDFGVFTYRFYEARSDFDIFALKKYNFVSKYVYYIIKGDLEEKLINELCDEIEERNKIRVK